MRKGEMARLGEVPFGRYYGTVDATPLFVMLVGEYFARTGDLATIRALWPNVMGALNWIDPRWRPRPGRLCRIPPPQRLRPRQSGMEGFGRCDLSRRRQPRRRS